MHYQKKNHKKIKIIANVGLLSGTANTIEIYKLFSKPCSTTKNAIIIEFTRI